MVTIHPSRLRRRRSPFTDQHGMVYSPKAAWNEIVVSLPICSRVVLPVSFVLEVGHLCVLFVDITSGGHGPFTVRRRCVNQKFIYKGFLGCRRERYPGCSAPSLASYALGPVNATCSTAWIVVGLLRPISCFTLLLVSRISIESIW